MTKQEVVLTVGLPASGKTTWANQKIIVDPNYININRDDIRLMMQGRKRYNKFSKWREKVVSYTAIMMAQEALSQGKSIIISDTNLNPGRNKNWEGIANEYNATYREELFTDIHYGECLDRDARREFPVGQRVITRMFESGRGIWFPEKPVYDPDLPDCYLCDIDGTVAQMDGRGPFEWMKVDTDEPNQAVIDVVNSVANSTTLIMLSGRDGVCKEMSRVWLRDNDVRFDNFFIRPAGDNRKDTLIKEEIYNNHIKGKYNVLGVFDDRDQVVHMWRHLGLTVFQVDYGNF